MKLQNGDVDPLERGPDNGDTALHTTIKSTLTQPSDMASLRQGVFQGLLARVESNCSPQNDCQETPLHTAVLVSRYDMAIMLIEAGADLTLRDNLERTPLELAKELEQDDIVAAIERALSKGSETFEGLEDVA
jgi:ankyrin repeat protein